MKGKILTGLLGILLILTVSFASALSISASPSSLTLNRFDNSKTITLTSTDNFDISAISQKTITDSDGDSITLTVSPTNYNNVTEAEFNITASGDFDDLNLGEYSTELNFNAVNANNSNDTRTINYTVNFNQVFCEAKNPGELSISDIEFDVKAGYGDDEDFWYPLDEIEVEFDVENDGDWDVEDIEIEACLYDLDEEECVIDEGDMDISNDDFDLDEDDDEKTVRLTFDLDPDDLNEGNNDYRLYLRATGEIDDSDAGDLDGNATCVSDFEDIEIITDDEFMVLGNFDIPETVGCDEEFQVYAEAWNIGDDELDDVSVVIRNEELNITKVLSLGDVDSFDSVDVLTNLKIPQDAEEKIYSLIFEVFDDDGDLFENDEDDEARVLKRLEVKGNCKKEVNASITASLISSEDAIKAGNTIEIKTEITNTGEQETTYTLALDRNELFSTVQNIQPSSLTLEPGEEGSSTITLKLLEDAEGEKVFDIKTVFNGNEIKQPVSLTIAKGFSLGNLGQSFKDNWFIWVIVLINIVLIVAIIIVAVKMTKSS